MVLRRDHPESDSEELPSEEYSRVLPVIVAEIGQSDLNQVLWETPNLREQM